VSTASSIFSGKRTRNFQGNDSHASEACVQKNGVLDTNRAKFSDAFLIPFRTSSFICIFIPKALYLHENDDLERSVDNFQ